MRWGLVIVVALLAQQVLAVYNISTCPADKAPGGGTVGWVDVPQGAIDETKKLFPESTKQSILAKDDKYFEFSTDGTIAFTFMWEGAGYNNVFGYFMIDKQGYAIANSFVTIFNMVTWKSEGGCMETGLTVNVSQQFKAGDKIGFWIRADGYGKPNNPVYYSLNNSQIYNPDGRHVVWAKLSTYDIVLIGFEDQVLSASDLDYNDVMFYTTVTGSYNDDDIPVYTNGTLEVCSSPEIVKYNEVACTPYAMLTSSIPSACQGYISVPAGWKLAPETQASKDAIKTFGADAGCIVLATGNGWNYAGQQCATGPLKSGGFNGTSCYTVGCDKNILVVGAPLTGSACTGIPNTACVPSTMASIVNKLPSAYTDGVAINPTKYGLFLNKLGGAAAKQDLAFAIAIPAKPQVEIQLLVDLNSMTSSSWSTFKTGASAIFNALSSDFTPLIGLSTISTNGELTVRPVTPFAANLVNQFSTVTNLAANANSNPSKFWTHFTTLANSNSAAGWSKGSAYRFIAVISTQTLDSSESTTAAVAAHLSKMIIPITLGTDLSSSLANFKMSGSQVITADTLASTWNSKLATVVARLGSTIRFTPVNDISSSGGFVQTLPADKLNPATGRYDTQITVRFPTVPTTSVSFPFSLNIIVWGYDVITVSIIVNTDPVILAGNSETANWNETKQFTIRASDADGNTLTVTYTGVTPANATGLIKSSAGVPFSTTLPSNSADFNPSFTPNGWPSGPIVLSGYVSDGCATAPFNFTLTSTTKPNFPPYAGDTHYVTLEDTPITTPLDQLADPDLTDIPALVAQVVGIYGQGTFYLDSTKSTVLTPSAVLSTVAVRNSIYYVPPPNAYSTGGVALGYFTFIVIDPQGKPSENAYTVSVTVTPVDDPPVFTGSTVITIDEDTRAELGLRDYLEDVDTDLDKIKIIIGENVKRGNLYECVTSDSGCDLVAITTVPYTIDIEGNPSGRVVFVPLPDENGDNYASFNLIADDGTNKPVFTITINVRPVNDPPVIIPFFSLLPKWNEMDEDTEFVLSWNVTDIDSPLESLTIDSRAIPQTFAGKLYEYVPNGDSYTRGDEVTGSGAIARLSPGIWSLIVVPNPNVYDNTFLRLRLTAYDDYQAPSLPVNAPVRVLPINDPPVISATEQTLTRTDNMQITLSFISVSDIDANRKNVSVSFTVDDSSVGVFGFDTLSNREERSNPCSLNSANTSVVCTDDLTSLNEKWFKLIIYYPGTSGSQVITVFADDLGHTDKWDRPMNDTKLIAVQIGEDTGLLSDPGTDNTLTIAVAVSVAGAVAAVALVLFLVRDKLAGQTDAYFESLTEPLSTGGVNPVYQQAGSSGQNPTYVPRV